jgi:hypothetical protein
MIEEEREQDLDDPLVRELAEMLKHGGTLDAKRANRPGSPSPVRAR